MTQTGKENNGTTIPQAIDEKSFWEKLKKHARTAGRDVVEIALKLYYALQDKDTPIAAKTVIIGALIYFITPTDAVPDFLPSGYVDDLGALMGALWTVASHIKTEHEERARERLRRWFGEQNPPKESAEDSHSE